MKLNKKMKITIVLAILAVSVILVSFYLISGLILKEEVPVIKPENDDALQLSTSENITGEISLTSKENDMQNTQINNAETNNNTQTDPSDEIQTMVSQGPLKRPSYAGKIVPPEIKEVGFVKGGDDLEKVLKNKTLRFYVPETWSHPYELKFVLYPKLKREYNLTVEAMPSQYQKDSLKAILDIKAGNQIDLIGLSQEKIPMVFNLCQPLNDKINYENIDKAYGIDKNLINKYKENDNLLYLPYKGGKEAIFYNTNLIKNAGLEDPYQVYKQGRWDFGTFKEYCNKLTVIKDGKLVQTAYACWPRGLYEFSLANKANFFDYNNGIVTSNINDDKLKNSLHYVKELYLNNSIHIFKGLGNYPEFYEQEKIAMAKLNYPENPKHINFGMVPLPKGENGENIITSSGIGYALPKNMLVKDNETAALILAENILNYMYDQEYREFEARLSSNPDWKTQYEDVMLNTPSELLMLYGVGTAADEISELDIAIKTKKGSIDDTLKKLETVFNEQANSPFLD